MPKYKIIIVDEVEKVIIERLTEAGLECLYQPHLTEEELDNIIHQFQGIVLRSRFQMNQERIEKAAQLKFIARTGAGMDNIDVKYAEQKNIPCLNAPEGNRTAVGEQTLGMLLSLMHKVNKADKEVKKRIWDREANRGEELSSKTVGIIGYGNMGKAFAKMLSGLEVRILAYDKYYKNFSDELVVECSLEEIFKQADILSLHIPLTEETNAWISGDWFQQFDKSIYFLNTSRGKIVTLEAIQLGLENNKLKGAALDVLWNEDINNLSEIEQLQMDFLCNHPQVILTPHVAGWTVESKIKLAEVLADKIIRFLTEV